jgi:hypothetical protein
VDCFLGNVDDNLAIDPNSQFVSTKVSFSSNVESQSHDGFLEI